MVLGGCDEHLVAERRRKPRNYTQQYQPALLEAWKMSWTGMRLLPNCNSQDNKLSGENRNRGHIHIACSVDHKRRICPLHPIDGTTYTHSYTYEKRACQSFESLLAVSLE